jgi:hypothetical protein
MGTGQRAEYVEAEKEGTAWNEEAVMNDELRRSWTNRGHGFF